jgi:hypothetical protein
MVKEYQFRVIVSEDGQVHLAHNCQSLVEFLGVLELAKALGLKLAQQNLERKEQPNLSKGSAIENPEEYLRGILESTKEVKVSGIVRSAESSL